MTIDTEKFRFRRFVEEMAKIEDVEVIESPTPLAAVADRLEGNPNGTWFRNVGPDGQELAGNVMGSRSRLAASLGVEERDLLSEVITRLRMPINPVEIDAEDAEKALRENGGVSV